MTNDNNEQKNNPNIDCPNEDETKQTRGASEQTDLHESFFEDAAVDEEISREIDKQETPTEPVDNERARNDQVMINDLEKVQDLIDKFKLNIDKKIQSLDRDVNFKIEEKVKISEDELNKLVKTTKEEFEKKVQDETRSLKERLDKQLYRTIEIVGVFSSVVALLVVNAGIVNSADTFLKASILIAGLSCVIIVFASLIHFFFNVDESRKPGLSLIAPFCVLIGLLIAGLVVEFACDGAYKNISSSKNDNISVEATVEQNFSDFSDHDMVVDDSKLDMKNPVEKPKKQRKAENCKQPKKNE